MGEIHEFGLRKEIPNADGRTWFVRDEEVTATLYLAGIPC